jgi:hypothetical protein
MEDHTYRLIAVISQINDSSESADSTGGCNTLDSRYRIGSVAHEIQTKNLLHRTAESVDVGTLA